VSLHVFVHADLGQLRTGDEVELTADEAKHALVKRIRVGEQITVTDGAGVSATCTVTAADKTSVAAQVDLIDVRHRETPHVVVVQAIPKGDRGELAVEMLTEVGVDVIVPWAASRSVAVWREEKQAKALARWRATAHAAAKQSRRAWFPEVRDMVGTDEVVELLRDASVPVVLHESASGPLADVPVPGRSEIVVVVGPEGGISDEELEAFAAVGAEPVRLGSSVLRSSTAGVAAVAALLARSRWR
jgi:16S rRNA (uracil1498-N3)-methyltransferase